MNIATIGRQAQGGEGVTEIAAFRLLVMAQLSVDRKILRNGEIDIAFRI